MKKKKIIIFMPSIEMGGVEKNLFIITNFLSFKFRDIKFITSSNNTQSLNKTVNIVRNTFLGSLIKSRILKILISSSLLIKELLKNNDKEIIVFSFQANLYSILITRLFGKKIVVRLNSSPSGWLNNRFKKFIYKKILSFSDKIIVNSQEFKKQIQTDLKLKSICIYNPLDKQNIKFKSNSKIKKPYRYKNSLKIINIGRLVDQKDHITLLKSINNIKSKINLELIIIGQGKNKNKLIDYIKKNNLEKIVKIAGYKQNPYPYLKCSDLYISSSIYEGLPNVLLEAITLKKFVISSDCPTGPKEILENGKGGILFKTGSIEDLSNKILMFKKKKRSLIKKTNFAYYNLKKFDMKKNLNSYYEILSKKN